ncbi:MAG: AraC family transcriptional regulator [Bacillota bacterium]|nr:AraC family transcriptional regulator [Bacillota bacterium]
MRAYRENKNIGNDYIPLRIYDISIDKYNVVKVESFSGFGKDIENEVCNFPSSVPHYHSYMEIIYVVEGVANMQVNNQYISLEKGNIMLIGSNEIHYLSGECRHIVLNIDPMTIHQIKDYHEDIFPKELEGKWIKKTEYIYSYITNCIDKVLKFYREKPEGYTLMIIGLIYELLGNVQNHSKRYSTSSNGDLAIKKEDLKRLNTIIDYINGNYSDEISIEDICSVVNLTPNYFCRFFKKNMGKTFFEYLNYYRCSQAEILLNSTDKSITEISNLVGFSSVSYFDKVYKKLKGYPPSFDKRGLDVRMA